MGRLNVYCEVILSEKTLPEYVEFFVQALLIVLFIINMYVL